VPSDVLTLAEAAAYLRVPEASVLRAIGPEGPPARLIEGEWRFYKPALQDWLRTVPNPSGREALAPAVGSWKERLLQHAGAAKNDPFLAEMLETIYRERGRPMIETEE
jgi:hypothetical protein